MTPFEEFLTSFEAVTEAMDYRATKND